MHVCRLLGISHPCLIFLALNSSLSKKKKNQWMRDHKYIYQECLIIFENGFKGWRKKIAISLFFFFIKLGKSKWIV